MPPQRVGFLWRFGLNTDIDFAYFGLESGLVFEETTGLPGDLWRHCGGLGKEILMPYPINQSWREQIELNWIGARVGLWDMAVKFLSPGPRNDVTDHLVYERTYPKRESYYDVQIRNRF